MTTRARRLLTAAMTLVSACLLVAGSISFYFAMSGKMRRDAANRALLHAALNRNLPSATHALADGADPNYYDHFSPLYAALQNDDFAMTQLLLQHGARTDLPDRHDAWNGHTVPQTGDARIVDLLLARHADVDAATPLSGLTALMSASFHGNSTLVELLLDHGANPCLRDSHGHTAWDFARYARHNRLDHKAITRLRNATDACGD